MFSAISVSTPCVSLARTCACFFLLLNFFRHSTSYFLRSDNLRRLSELVSNAPVRNDKVRMRLGLVRLRLPTALQKNVTWAGLNLDKILSNSANVKAQEKVYLRKCNCCIVDCDSGSGTQISGSGSGFSFRHLKRLATDLSPTSKNLRIRLQNDLVNWKLKKNCLICTIVLIHQHRWGVAK